jgi:hypothetical protein
MIVFCYARFILSLVGFPRRAASLHAAEIFASLYILHTCHLSLCHSSRHNGSQCFKFVQINFSSWRNDASLDRCDKQRYFDSVARHLCFTSVDL